MQRTSTRLTWSERRQPPEMLEKPHLHETFFSLKGVKDRPVSVATEFMESDFDDDEILSEIEDGENSPRTSLNSGQPSITTLSSYDEVQTPRSSRAPTAFQFETASLKQVEGPRGPHLFRSSMLSANSVEYQNALSLSPVTPKVASAFHKQQQYQQQKAAELEFQLPIGLDLQLTPLPPTSKLRRRNSGPFRFTDEELDDTSTLATWPPEKVAQWMLNAGVELAIAEKFVENDITGGILITLKFEDLKELGIPSFGARTKIWEEMHVMRNLPNAAEPMPETPIEDAPDKTARRELRRQDKEAACEGVPRRRQSSRRRRQPKLDDVISPLESVSIVGIEQVVPKVHNCSKGKDCPNWKKSQKLIQRFKKEFPSVDVDKGGIVMVAGDPGNPETAASIPKEDIFRPVSDAMPSVVASSDVMGPGSLPPLEYLREATLASVPPRDPQDNVRQFLDFQHQHIISSSEVPPTPPFEIYPGAGAHQAAAAAAPRERLHSLPKLSIPGQTHRLAPKPASAHPSAQPCSAHPYAQTGTAAESSPDLTPTAPYRFGTPFSDMDVPVTAVPLGPVARDFSQSVPPDMNYRSAPNSGAAPPSRSMSRSSHRRPSFALMPALDENTATPIAPRQSPRASVRPTATTTNLHPHQRPLQPPPRVQYPWTSERGYEKAIAPVPTSASTASSSAASATSSSSARSLSPKIRDAEGVTYQGPMKKRKTKMLRHEWHDQFFTLKGTRLNMHKDARSVDRTLEYIDIDDYAIMCSSFASNKLSTAFKAMSLRRGSADNAVGGSGKGDVAAFAFQLIPQDQKGGVRLRKRESALPTPAAAAAAAAAAGPPGEGTNTTGKAHHFAVKGRDERIDWMRELMLAKALKQKGAGFEVSVNGNMI